MARLLLLVAAVLMAGWEIGGHRGVVLGERRVPVVFGDELMPTLVSRDTPPCVSSSQLGSEVCDEDPEYNDRIKQHALTLLRQDMGVNSLLSNPSLRSLLSDPDKNSTIVNKIATRFGGVSENPVCAAQETIIYPKRAKTSREDWVFVLNQENVQQALRVEKCIKDGSSCNIGGVLPGDARATCRQKYVYRRMLVVGSNKIAPEEVLMPSCCVCYTTYDGLVLRFGNGTDLNTAAPSQPQPSIPPPSRPPAAAQPAAQPGRRPTITFDRSMNRPFIRFPVFP